ncbi:serine hydroxymethyltransferase [Streptomyces sp. NPDC051133]|uniref:serine hydroxymethyltransferase n=1 Tax=Streptomyces sp. NPDC051133 TaxID=3155521 RepID=UPI0034268EAD
MQRDPELAQLIRAEADRQSSSLQLLAGENFTSATVMEALDSPLINKYAEGYPGRRHHGGCEVVDRIEDLAVRRAKDLFKCGYANVQPYSGTNAVLAAYWVLLEPGDKVLAMSRSVGGHFTHGLASNISGRTFDFAYYGVRADTGIIDYDQVRELAQRERPRVIVCGGNFYPRKIDYKSFRRIADEVGAFLIADCSHELGLIAGKAVPSPVPYADVVCAVTHKTLRGPRGGLLLSSPQMGASLDAVVYPFFQGGPHLHTIAGKAAAFGEASTPEFAAYAQQTVKNAQMLAQGLAERGLRLITGGTDTHQMIADVAPLGVSSAQARDRCRRSGIVLDVLPVHQKRGDCIRLGTAAMTSLGMREAEMISIAELIGRALVENNTGTAKRGVSELLASFRSSPLAL